MKAQLLTGLTVAAAVAGGIATAEIANANTLTRRTVYQQTQFDLNNVPTNYLDQGYGRTDILNSIMSIEQFSPSQGTLRSVKINFSGDITVDGGLENRDARSQTVTANLLGELELKLPNGTSLFDLNPTNSRTFENVSRYDGRQDFAGNSGRTFEGLTASGFGERTFTDSSFLQQFMGNSVMNFMFSATATSSFTGSGNLSTYVDTFARSALMVTYEYEELPRKIPEPATTLGLGLVAGLGLLSQKKKIWKKA
jgi:hypothetical protein